MAKRLTYEIGVDASKGVGGLKQFSSAVKKAMQDVEGSVDDTATSAQKLAKVFSGLAGELEGEMKEAAAAAKALGDALGPEVAGRADLDSIVADLNKMGLSFDEIRADADVLAASLKELDSVQMKGVQGGMANVEASTKRAKAGVDDVGRSAGSSQSALANMVGNATQDIGALGGIAGSAGVAIGQIGEYMADAALGGEKFATVVKNFAVVAGPIAAIAAVLSVVQGVMASNEERAAAAAEATKAYGQAMNESANDAIGLADVLRDNTAQMQNFVGAATTGGDLVREVFSNLPLVGALLKDDAVDVIEVLNTMGVGFGEVGDAIGGNVDSWNNIQAKLEEFHDQGLITDNQLKQTTRFINEQRDAVKNAEEEQAFLNLAVGEGNELYDELIAKRRPLSQFPEMWDTVFEAIRTGTLDSEKATDAINFLRRELGIPLPENVISLAMDEIARKADTERDALDANRDATEKWREEQARAAEEANEFAAAITEAQFELNDMASTFNEMARREGAIGAAFDLGDAPFEAAKNISDINVAAEDLAAFLRENPFDTIDFGPGPQDFDAAPFLAKVDALKGPIQQRLSNAFVTGGEEAARATAQGLIESIYNGLDGALSREQIDQLLFGPGGYTAVIDIAVDQTSLAKAKAMIQLLTGLPGADPLWTAQVLLDLQADKLTPEAVNVLVAEKLGALGLDVPTSLLPPDDQSMTDAKANADAFYRNHPALMKSRAGVPDNLATVHRDAQTALNKVPLVIPVKYKITDRNPLGLDSGGTANGVGGVAGEVGPEFARFPGNGRQVLLTEPTYVPPGTRVTSRKQTARILRTRGLRRYDMGGVVSGGPITVNVNAGVVGNRYDVMRAVQRANLDKVRLLGTRG